MDYNKVIEILVENVIKAAKHEVHNAKFDRTSIGHMVKNNGDGTYEVNVFGGFYNIAYDGEIQPRQVVYVTAPQNDFKHLFITKLG